MLLNTLGWHTAPSAYCLGLACRDKAEQQNILSVQAINKGLKATSHAVCMMTIILGMDHHTCISLRSWAWIIELC